MSETQALKSEVQQEAKKRRTFAIISHPDAGKTTLTEKLLLYSGMLRTAGMVGGRKSGKTAASDWMSMEQERGISITASAMQFSYRDTVINVLDTPGHQDFSEDTYRTLTAADSVIMVMDAAKGVEAQTRKLFDACRLRSIPVITFINKMDMPPKDPLDLMQEVEDVLGIQACAMNWPIGLGKEFQGIMDRQEKRLIFYTKTGAGGSTKPEVEEVPWQGLDGHERLNEMQFNELEESIELLEEAGNPYSLELFLSGKTTPVYFGSAMTNFGVEPLFDALVDIAPCPSKRSVDMDNDKEDFVDPADEPFSAYVFKMQANMNPKHRDCVAFLRINSGRYEKDLTVKHQRIGKKIRLPRPHSLQVSERHTLDKAYPGDIIGVINSGHFIIGDTITTGKNFNYKPLPQFQPELFASVRPIDLGKRKAIDKGLEQLAAEGAVQMVWDWEDDTSFPYIAAIGRLQFEVLQYRLKDEYGVKTELTPLSYSCSAWLKGDLESFKKPSRAKLMKDRLGRPMVLFNDVWEKNYALKENPDHELLDYA